MSLQQISMPMQISNHQSQDTSQNNNNMDVSFLCVVTHPKRYQTVLGCKLRARGFGVFPITEIQMSRRTHRIAEVQPPSKTQEVLINSTATSQWTGSQYQTQPYYPGN